jgi:hypothetical protein
MAVIFRLTAREQREHPTCCFCGRDVETNPVEFFVFWPGDEDPTPWFAHAECVPHYSSIRKPGAATHPNFETRSRRS